LLYHKEAIMPLYMGADQWFAHIVSGFRSRNEVQEF